VAFAELKNFGHEGSSSRLSGEQESALSDWVDTHCPRSIREIAAFLKRTFGQSYSRSGLIALLHRLGFDYPKPEAMPRGLDDARPQAFIDQYEPGPSPCGRPERPVRPIRRKFCVRN
jgi:transposase